MLALTGTALGLLVNSASVYKETPLGGISAETWDSILATNLRAPFLLSQKLGLAMKAAGGGHIVNIGDWAGLRPYRSYLPYVVSKAGLIHMTRALALELAPEVQVNCVCPGRCFCQRISIPRRQPKRDSKRRFSGSAIRTKSRARCAFLPRANLPPAQS